MGLFKRNQAAVRKPATKARPSISSEAQASELRVRARRRLAGAIALVLAAVVVLPMLLDSEPVPVADDISIRIPDRNASFQTALPTSPSTGVDQTPATPGAAGQVTLAAPGALPPAGSLQSPAVIPEAKLDDKPKEPPKAKPEVKEAAKPSSTPKLTARTEDGARALAMLEGRAPDSIQPAAKPQPKPAVKGNFVVQVASYGSQADAQARREKLYAAGITNAFIEPVTVNGKSVFRLRVGSFPSREAAQAAQTRLRTLGYENGFITTQ